MRELFSKTPVASHSKVKIALSLAFFTVKKTAPLRARFEGGRYASRQNSEASHPAIMDESDLNSVIAQEVALIGHGYQLGPGDRGSN